MAENIFPNKSMKIVNEIGCFSDEPIPKKVNGKHVLVITSVTPGGTTD